MKRYEGGAAVPPGLYWSPGRWELKAVSGGRGILGGEKAGGYVRVPGVLLPLVMLSGAVAGGLYIVFLPLIASALLLWFSGLKTWHALHQGVRCLTALFSDRWAPGESHFAGKDRRKRGGGC